MRFRQNFVVDFDKFNGLEAYVNELKASGIRTIIILVSDIWCISNENLGSGINMKIIVTCTLHSTCWVSKMPLAL